MEPIAFMKTIIHTILAASVLAASALAAYAMVPRTILSEVDPPIEFASALPGDFGDWKLIPSVHVVVPTEPDALANKIYSQMTARGYTDGQGNSVMLLVAYGPRQSNNLQLHAPELCYVAEGFRVQKLSPVDANPGGSIQPFKLTRMVAKRGDRTEQVSYWMRVGDDIISALLGRQYAKLSYGLRGVVPDGVLIRMSSISTDRDATDALHARFLKDLMQNIGENKVKYFVGKNRVNNQKLTGVMP